MKTETIITNEFVNSSPLNNTSILKVILWLVVLLFSSQICLGFAFGIYYGMQQGENFTPELFNTWFMSIPVMLSVSIISPIITLPLLVLATGEKSWPTRFNLWAIKVINKKTLFNWLVLFLIFWLTSLLLGEWLKLPEEQFMIDIKAANNSITKLLLILTAICIVIPIMEELVFRGWLYSKISMTKLGDKGALLLTSLIFMVVHSQYENLATLIMLFSLGVLLGLVRYKTNNISYSILAHMLFNSLSMISLLLF